MLVVHTYDDEYHAEAVEVNAQRPKAKVADFIFFEFPPRASESDSDRLQVTSRWGTFIDYR